MTTMNKKLLIIGVILLVLLAGGIAWFLSRSSSAPTPKAKKKPTPQINLIPLKDRPYITLQPLSGRNQLEFTIHTLPKKAKTAELTLEYDRNKGVLDAVLYQFTLSKVPFVSQAFLGSKSAGGHTTYHEDVIGGNVTLVFEDDDYALEVPWRYDDTQTEYKQLSTTDGKFQLELANPVTQPKVIVMETSGLPADVKGEVIAGPYFVSTVGTLPTTTATIHIRLNETVEKATIVGWDGTNWVEYKTSLEGKTASATGPLVSTYVVIK